MPMMYLEAALRELSSKVTDKMTDKELLRWNKIERYIQKNGGIKNANAQTLLNISESTAKRFLRKMVEIGNLKLSGENKNRIYYLK